jgi:hypothetical protein
MLCNRRIRTRRLLPTFSRAGLLAPYRTGSPARLAPLPMACPIFPCRWERWRHCGQRQNSRATAIPHLCGQSKLRHLQDREIRKDHKGDGLSSGRSPGDLYLVDLRATQRDSQSGSSIKRSVDLSPFRTANPAIRTNFAGADYE